LSYRRGWIRAWRRSSRSARVTNRRFVSQGETKRYEPPVRVRQGDEIMTFHLGSTVVLLFEPGRLALDPGLRAEMPVRLGQVLGRGDD
jgi:phosphatidylserine decarboxylase